MRVLSVVFGLWSGVATAQSIAEGVDLQSAAGRISIVETGNDYSRALQVGDALFFEGGMYPFLSIEDQRGALYLIGLSSGGTACAAEYVWLHTEGGTARVSEMFGNCSDLIEVSSDAETVRVTMPSFAANEGFVTYIYDGRTIQEVVEGQRSANVGLNGGNWVGRYPYEVMRDADWRATLAAMMGEEAYGRAGDVMAVATPFEVQGLWVVGEGFAPRMAGDARGLVALHTKEDGRAIVAIRTEDHGVEVWGELDGSVPQAVMRFMQGG